MLYTFVYIYAINNIIYHPVTVHLVITYLSEHNKYVDSIQTTSLPISSFKKRSQENLHYRNNYI